MCDIKENPNILKNKSHIIKIITSLERAKISVQENLRYFVYA